MINHTARENISSAGRDIITSLTRTTRFQLLFSLRIVAVFTLVAVASQNVHIARLIVDSSSFNKITDTSDINAPQLQPPETSQSKSSSSSTSPSTSTSLAAAAAAEWKNNDNSTVLSPDDHNSDHPIAKLHSDNGQATSVPSRQKSISADDKAQEILQESATAVDTSTDLINDNVPLHQAQQIPLPSIVYFFNNYCGLGSSLINLFVNAAFFKDLQNRSSICVYESHYHYRLNASIGVLTGFFTPQFPVIDTPEQYSLLLTPHLLDLGFNMTAWPKNDPASVNKIRQFNDRKPPVALVNTFSHRENVVRWYRQISMKLYGRLVNDMCPHLQFNDRTKAQILEYSKKLNVPDAFGNKNESTTIGFHIRRGDKLIAESRKYEAYEYLQRFEQEAGVDVVRRLEHCFVATDDPAAIPEFHAALKNYSNWSCMVHSFTDAAKDIIQDSTYQFLTELSILVDAAYFVGTFNSNVGSLVSLLRSCPRRLDENFSVGNYSHFGQSYGTDRDYWFFW